MHASEDRKYLTPREFHEKHRNLGINLIYQWAREDVLPSIRVGGKILIPSDALDQLADSRS